LEAFILQALGPNAESYGVVVRNLTSRTEAVVNPDKVFYPASLYKLPIFYEVYKQREMGLLDFDRWLTLTGHYVEQDEGTLALLGWDEGATVSVRQAVEAMITVSDNASAWMLRDLVGSAPIDADMARLGLKHTTVDSSLLTTSARDMAILLESMARGQAVNPAASREMVELLTQQTVRDRIPALLPPDTRVANKTGDWLGATHDVAIVYSPSATYVIAILSDRTSEPEPIAELSLAVYDYFQTHGGG
jgi:beta-lactamase class A